MFSVFEIIRFITGLQKFQAIDIGNCSHSERREDLFECLIIKLIYFINNKLT